MKKEIAEFIGTFTLVLVGCGSPVIAGGDIGLTGISFAFGLALIAMAYGIGQVSAFLFEFVATFLFMVVIVGATGAGAPASVAGLAIGLALVAIHLVGINVTGVSVNPARSIGTALFAGGQAISQVWLFIFAPILGAVAAGAVIKSGLLDGDTAGA